MTGETEVAFKRVTSEVMHLTEGWSPDLPPLLQLVFSASQE